MPTTIPLNEAAFTALELAAISHGDLTRLPDAHARVAGIATDSRVLSPGNAFVALRGERMDGHDFLRVVIERGATAVVIERGRSVPAGVVAVVEVNDALVAFGQLAQAHLRRWRAAASSVARVVAVTGSAGKTTTKDFIASLLGAVAPCHATTGNLNNRVGLPAVALALRGESYAVFELGMSLPGEIAKLAEIVEPDVAVLLNVGVAHAEGFGGSKGAIAAEKGAILEALSSGGVAVINMDDEAARAQLVRTSAARVGFGVSLEADVRLVRREGTARGSRVTIERRGRAFELELPVAGEAVALDLIAAIAAADAAARREIPVDVIAASIAAWEPPAGRSVTIELAGDVWALDDSYNANPASMRAAFATVSELRRGGRRRAIAVLGEMRELGPIAEQEHDELGVELARHGFDLVIGCGGAIDIALRRAEASGVAVRYAPDARDAGAAVTDEVRAGDVVLFKGSRAAGVERALQALIARHPVVDRAAAGGP